ncbi:MAG: FHA domain-containing serine/threonine-protein kinase [Chthoniobacter sp.]
MASSSFLALEAVVRQDDRLIARCLLHRGKYIIGQERKNEIVVDAESISGRHARLTVASEEHLFLEDLGSANGTFVDGCAIEASTPVTLESDIRVGDAQLTFQRGGLPAAVFRHLPENFLRSSRYALGEVIVEGRTSTIFEARDTVLQRRVAMKVLHPAGQANVAQVLAFIREYQIVAQLNHCGILPVFDFGLDEEIGLFSATRFIEGESLGTLLTGMASGQREAPHATLHVLLTLFLKACDAVAFAHTCGVVHGCLHPEAIIFGRFGEVFVDHWSAARIGEPREAERARLQAPEVSAPSPVSRCLAPEQAADAEVINARADVFALGAILFRILTLRNFNNGESEEEIVAEALHPALPPAEALGASPPPAHLPGGALPERLAAVCAAALSFNREDRFSTAHDLKLEIANWLEQAVDAGTAAASRKRSSLFSRR